jgi:hypothetical protein
MFILRLRFAGGEVRFHRPRILGLEELDEAVTLVEPKVGLPFSTLGLKALYHCDLPHPEAPSVALRPRRDRNGPPRRRVQPARVIVDEAATEFFGGHKPMPGGASLATTVDVHIQYGGVARPSPALEVTGEFGLR